MRPVHLAVLLALGLGLASPTTPAAEPAPAAPRAAAAPPTLTVEQAERELRILRRALEALHPGLYRRLTPAQLEAEFARARAEVADGSDVLEMYRLTSRIAAALRCGHTWTNPLNQGPAVQAALGALPALPLRIRVLEGRWLVTASADPAVPAGSEIIAIDGRSPQALVDAFMPYLRADGDSDGKRIDQLESDPEGGALDRLLPQLFPPPADGYRLRVRTRDGRTRQARVAGMPVAQREAALAAAGLPAEDTTWRLDIDGETAVLTLPTFAFWDSDDDWRGFLDRSFERMEQAGVQRLVLDLRRNEGGDLAIADALLAHVLQTPLEVPASRMVSAYERAPYILVRYLNTWDYDFFDRTGQVRKAEDGGWELIEQPAPRRIEPVARPFRGRVAMLTGPRMSSSGFLIARDFQRSGRGVLVGRPTGGSQRGLNGGQLAWLKLPHSEVAVDIPLIAGFTPGTGSANPPPDRGVLPDIAVRTRLEDAAAGRDPDMDAARRWLAGERASAPRARTPGAGLSACGRRARSGRCGP